MYNSPTKTWTAERFGRFTYPLSRQKKEIIQRGQRNFFKGKLMDYQRASASSTAFEYHSVFLYFFLNPVLKTEPVKETNVL